VLGLEERVLLSGLVYSVGQTASPTASVVLDPTVMQNALPITIGAPTTGIVAAGGAQFFQVASGSDGRLIAQRRRTGRSGGSLCTTLWATYSSRVTVRARQT